MTIRQLPSPRRLWPAIPLLAAVLRVVNLGGRALWYDEAFSVLFARRSVGEMIAGTLGPQAAAAEEHPLLYYFTLHGWMRLFGETPAAVRLPSVLAGIATIALLYLLGQR
ncbi:MAG: glycosyltransferase family 39 protein, partial [Anaerolineales bacterium]|nr:glycosyltransferase family 39 protein [Anaerolineales bacterium]